MNNSSADALAFSVNLIEDLRSLSDQVHSMVHAVHTHCSECVSYKHRQIVGTCTGVNTSCPFNKSWNPVGYRKE